MTALLIALLILLLFSSAYFSAAETALFSLSPLTLRSYKGRGDPRLALIAKMMSRPRDILVTILMLNVLANLLVQNTVSSLFNAFPSWLLKVGVPLALTLIFGEVLPKSVAMTNNAAVAYRTAPFISSATRILRPIRNPLTKATGWISRVLFFFFRKEKDISADELRHVLKTSQET